MIKIKATYRIERTKKKTFEKNVRTSSKYYRRQFKGDICAYIYISIYFTIINNDRIYRSLQKNTNRVI